MVLADRTAALEVVLAKADAAAVWCKHATAHANENGGERSIEGEVCGKWK